MQLRNPIQPAEFIDDGQIIVDVIATDASGEVFQVEMHSWNHAALKERILYAWATLYKAQLEKGDKYTELRPVVSIWLMDENTWREVPREIDTPVLESAMSVLTDFQTNAARNDLYRSRLDYLRVQNTMADELAQALADKAQAFADREQALAREIRLRERMFAAGIDPDDGE